MSTFKQIIGRGTRVFEDGGKLYFEIFDFTGSATRNFADSAFDGDAIIEEEDTLEVGVEFNDERSLLESDGSEDTDELERRQSDDRSVDEGTAPNDPRCPDADFSPREGPEFSRSNDDDDDDDDTNETQPRKYYVDGGEVHIVAQTVQILDADGKLRVVRYIEYAGERVREVARSAVGLQARWLAPELRDEVLHELAVRGIDVGELAEMAGATNVDPFDLLCHVAFNAPLRTRRDRVQAMRDRSSRLWERYPPEAREVLTAILDKYAEFGDPSMDLPDALKTPPISEFGNVIEIAARFGGVPALREAVAELRRNLYAVDLAS